MGLWDTIIGGLSNGNLLKGIGSVAGAWGSYETGKRSNKIAKEQLEFDRKQQAKADAKLEAAQAELDSALNNIYGQPKKKKKKDLSLAFESPAV